MKKQTLISLIILLIVLSLFVTVSYFVQENLPYLQSLISNTFIGMSVYLFMIIFEIVLAPITFIPIIPLASALWGWILAGLLTLTGWTLGAVIAFFIARKWGVPLIKKFVSLGKIQKLEKLIFKKHIFLGIILLRILIPIDVINYAIGLFSKVNWKTYSLATLIGFAPLAFFLAYFGLLPIYYQIIGFFSIGIFILLVLIIFFRKIFRE